MTSDVVGRLDESYAVPTPMLTNGFVSGRCLLYAALFTHCILRIPSETRTSPSHFFTITIVSTVENLSLNFASRLEAVGDHFSVGVTVMYCAPLLPTNTTNNDRDLVVFVGPGGSVPKEHGRRTRILGAEATVRRGQRHTVGFRLAGHNVSESEPTRRFSVVLTTVNGRRLHVYGWLVGRGFNY